MQALVSPAGDHTFLVTATRGSLSGATDGFRVPPFSDRARGELGIAVEVGVGLGRTAQEAEAHARAALARSHAAPGARGFALDREGYALVPAPRAPAAAPPGRPKGLETLSRLAGKLPDDDGAHVVDAETAGRLLGVTPRTARSVAFAATPCSPRCRENSRRHSRSVSLRMFSRRPSYPIARTTMWTCGCGSSVCNTMA